MQDPVPPKKIYEDEWGDTRAGYEDRSAYRPQKKKQSAGGNRFVGTLGSLIIVGGIAWGAYLVTSSPTFDTSVLLKFPGPVHVCAVGLIISVISKFMR